MYRCLLTTVICDDVINIDKYLNKTATKTKIIKYIYTYINLDLSS